MNTLVKFVVNPISVGEFYLKLIHLNVNKSSDTHIAF